MLVSLHAIECNNCKTFSIPRLTAGQAIAKARHDGWQIGENGAPDLCPGCILKVLKLAKEEELEEERSS